MPGFVLKPGFLLFVESFGPRLFLSAGIFRKAESDDLKFSFTFAGTNLSLMSDFDDYYFLGKIFKPHGYQGKVNAWLDVDDPSEYDSLKMVYLNLNGNLIPYFIESIRILNNKAVIAFQDFKEFDQATQLSNTEMYLPLSELPELTGTRFYYHEVIGFTLVDEEKGVLGPIKQVLDYPNQAVMQVFCQNKEVLIPVNKEVIRALDRDKKEMHIRAPDGLIDLYLSM